MGTLWTLMSPREQTATQEAIDELYRLIELAHETDGRVDAGDLARGLDRIVGALGVAAPGEEVGGES